MIQESLYSTSLIEQTRLPSGLKVLTERIPGLRSLSVGVWVERGSRHEPKDRSGVLHFIEHMLFKGTETRDTAAIARIIDSLGGQMNAFTGKENTCFYARVLDEHLEPAIELLGDLILHPAFHGADIERERKVILEEIKMVDDTPDDLVQNLFVERFWRGSDLARPILGTRRSVAGLAAGDLRSWFRENVKPSSLLVVASGAVEHGPFVERMWKTLRELKGQAPAVASAPPSVHGGVTIRRKPGLNQAYVCLGVPAWPRNHPGRYVLSVLNTILGTGMSSRLFQVVREQRSLAYDVFSDTVAYADAGYLSIYAATGAASVHELVDVIREELRKLRARAVGKEELKRAKEHLKGNLMLGLESSFNRMTNLASQEIYFGRQETLDEILRSIDAVDREQVLAAARELLDGRSLSAAILGKLPEGFDLDRARLEL